MNRLLAIGLLVLPLSSCGPPLVWGGDAATKARLLKLLPIGSTTGDLRRIIAARGWRVLNHDDRQLPKGTDHYFGGGCQYQGGVSTDTVVAEYGILTTSVEALWMFDAAGKLSDLCIRRTTDGP